MQVRQKAGERKEDWDDQGPGKRVHNMKGIKAGRETIKCRERMIECTTEKERESRDKFAMSLQCSFDIPKYTSVRARCFMLALCYAILRNS